MSADASVSGVMATPYRESYGEDDYTRPENVAWTPSYHAGESAWWDEEDDYNPDETEDYLAASIRYFENRNKVSGGVWYDVPLREWKCRCQEFEDRGKCRHLHRFRPQETINLIEGYL